MTQFPPCGWVGGRVSCLLGEAMDMHCGKHAVEKSGSPEVREIGVLVGLLPCYLWDLGG